MRARHLYLALCLIGTLASAWRVPAVPWDTRRRARALPPAALRHPGQRILRLGRDRLVAGAVDLRAGGRPPARDGAALGARSWRTCWWGSRWGCRSSFICVRFTWRGRASSRLTDHDLIPSDPADGRRPDPALRLRRRRRAGVLLLGHTRRGGRLLLPLGHHLLDPGAPRACVAPRAARLGPRSDPDASSAGARQRSRHRRRPRGAPVVPCPAAPR